jgi:cyanophycinase-like exopeptidase
MKKHFLLPCLIVQTGFLFAQSFTAYYTGNPSDRVTAPMGGVCLMGGARENDEAMRWFLQRANGGDVLVLRASGSDGYHNYLYQELGVPVNSVETIVFHSRSASYDSYVRDRIMRAEAIWIAGGDQWKYVSYWRDTAVDSLINLAIRERNIVIGGTSAGMAVLGGFYFTAENGTVTSSAALSNPYHPAVRVDTARFFQVPFLQHVVTDTHYDNPDRRGRHVAFLARVAADSGLFEVRGIACEEFTAICIEPDGIARVFGSYPGYDDHAWFIQVNCESPDPAPERCESSVPLTWFREAKALKAYKLAGTNAGTNFFNLATWEGGSGGSWEDWSVQDGVFSRSQGVQMNCDPLFTGRLDVRDHALDMFPNPSRDGRITVSSGGSAIQRVEVMDVSGRIIYKKLVDALRQTNLPLDHLPPSVYIVRIYTVEEVFSRILLIL